MNDLSRAPRLAATAIHRRLPVGAEVQPKGGVHFRVWAPLSRRVEVVLRFRGGNTSHALDREAGGYFSGFVPEAKAGVRYRYRLDGLDAFPDPASRFQPDGPHGDSEVVDAAAFVWTDGAWRGVSLHGQVIYEMHVGTFTREGNWKAAARELEELAALGVTLMEIMPVAEFSGRRGWGYDGVDLYAPTRLYGTPDDFRRFVDRAHALGLGVILDVVYNHVGPDGSYLKAFSPYYFTDCYDNEWGEPINFDGEHSGPVREFFISNAGYWIDEFHIDGLRLDATQQIFDASDVHVLTEISERVRRAACGRATLVVAENEPQHAHLVRPVRCGGCGIDAVWNDDFHHSAMVALTGRNEAYYTDYHGTPPELLAAVKWGFLYQGQHSLWQDRRRGTPAFDIPPAAFVNYIQNHDQIANTGLGVRAHRLTTPGRYRAMTALLLLAPGTPMLFQGQEFASSSPFLYFADHEPELARAICRGRAEFATQFSSSATPEAQARLPDPGAAATFERCKVDFDERHAHAEAYALHRDLIALRRTDPVFSRQTRCGLEGAMLGAETFLLRFFGENGADRLLLVNLGRDLDFSPAPEPLLAPPLDCRWHTLWSSEDPRYGGHGTPPLETNSGWRIHGHAAVVLYPSFDPAVKAAARL